MARGHFTTSPLYMKSCRKKLGSILLNILYPKLHGTSRRLISRSDSKSAYPTTKGADSCICMLVNRYFGCSENLVLCTWQ